MPYGRVEVTREGNRVRIESRGVEALRLLLSPGTAEAPEFDFAKPVLVTWNGSEVFAGRLEPDPGTLLRWARRDEDRSRLFAFELALKLP